MGGFTTQITGLKELDEKLGEMKTATAKRIVRRGLLEGARVFQTAVKARAPERVFLPSGTALPPGVLRQDVEIHFGTNDQNLPAAIVEPGRYTRHVARWVEYGHRQIKGGYNRVIKVGPKAGKQRGIGHEVGAPVPEHPYIRPAYEAARELAVQAACTAIAKGIENAAKTGKGLEST
jgi:Bacteriophage HK97-gp10, putative tail-component